MVRDDENVLSLEGEREATGRSGPGSSRSEYPHEQKHYAALYKQSDRTIKRWVKKGREANDLPPLDDPVAMTAWWPRHYKHKIPSEILEARGGVPSPAPQADASPVRVVAPVREESSSLGEKVGVGFRDMLERVRKAEREAYQRWQTAMDGDDESGLAQARRNWNELSKQLRELERDASDILAKGGSMADKATVEKVIAEIHVPIVNGIRSMWRRIKPRILGQSDAQQEKIWNEECNRLLARLNETEFTVYE